MANKDVVVVVREVMETESGRDARLTKALWRFDGESRSRVCPFWRYVFETFTPTHEPLS